MRYRVLVLKDDIVIGRLILRYGLNVSNRYQEKVKFYTMIRKGRIRSWSFAWLFLHDSISC